MEHGETLWSLVSCPTNAQADELKELSRAYTYVLLLIVDWLHFSPNIHTHAHHSLHSSKRKYCLFSYCPIFPSVFFSQAATVLLLLPEHGVCVCVCVENRHPHSNRTEAVEACSSTQTKTDYVDLGVGGAAN